MSTRFFFKYSKGTRQLRGSNHLCVGRNIHFYKISSQLFTDRRTGPCHIVSFFSKQAYNKWLFVLKPRVSNTLCDKMKFLLISIICQEKNPKSPYIMVAMVTIQNIVNFKMTTYLGLQA